MLQGLVNRVRMYLAEAKHQLQWQSEDLPVAELLASFTIEFDDKNDKKHDYLVKRLANGSDFPPILVLRHPDGRYEILDGHHRISAYDEVGRDTISAVVGVVEA